MAYTVLQHKSNFSLRALTALVVIPFVVFITLQKPIYIQSLMVLASIGIFREWSKLTISNPKYFMNYICIVMIALLFIPSLNQIAPFIIPIVYAGFYISHKKSLPNAGLISTGYFYLTSSLAILTHILPFIAGPKFILLILIMIWLVDTGAFLIGKSLGGPKLAPQISPNKTWSGFIGGILISSIGTCFLYKKFFTIDLPYFWLLIAISLPIAQIGDLLESWAKRYFKVKDSGSFFPGHGGLLDRLDSLFSVSFVIAIWWYLFINN